MSDESPRSAHGNPPNQGWGEGIPAWWTELNRTDLPDDPVAAPVRPRSAGTATRAFPQRRQVAAPRPPRPAPAAARHGESSAQQPHARRRLANTATVVVIVVAAVLATWVGLGDASARGLVVVALVFGVPTLLTMFAVSLVVRRGGR